MPKKRAKSPTWKKLIGAAFYLVFCILFIVMGTVGWMMYETPMLGKIVWNTIAPKKPVDVFHGDTVTILVLGCDEDLSPGGKKVLRANARSDMMLVAKLDFANKRIGGVSIPRDLEVALPGYSAKKINAYHSIGGKDLSKQAAEYVLGITIDRVIELNFEAFQDLVNIVGGVDVYVPKDMHYTDKAGDLYIDLKKGRQHLDGYKAMGFVRFRHSDSDLMRMPRQRDFMLSLKDSIKKNPGLIGPFTTKAGEVIGGEFDDDEMIALAQFAQSIPGDSIKMSNLPVVEGRGTNLILDSDKLQQVLEENYLVTPISSRSTVAGQ